MQYTQFTHIILTDDLIENINTGKHLQTKGHLNDR